MAQYSLGFKVQTGPAIAGMLMKKEQLRSPQVSTKIS